MSTVVETFDSISIKNASIQFKSSDGTIVPGTKFGALGSIDGETELKPLVKTQEGVEVKRRDKPMKMNLTVSAHIPVKVIRDVFGITNTDLKPGIYKYSKLAEGKEFILTADVIDEFEDITKLVAFPNSITASGYQFSIENGAEEVAEVELSLAAYPDDQGNIMYEAYVSELEDQTIAETWHTSFDYSLVELVPAV
jgi:hypothetical protein